MDGKADIGCLLTVNAIESVTSGSILKDFVFELLVFFQERINHQFHFSHIHIVIVGIGMNQERFCSDFSHSESAIDAHILRDSLSAIVRCDNRLQTDRNKTCRASIAGWRDRSPVRRQRRIGNYRRAAKSASAQSCRHDSIPPRQRAWNRRSCSLDHVVATFEHIVVFAATVIDAFVKIFPYPVLPRYSAETTT